MKELNEWQFYRYISLKLYLRICHLNDAGPKVKPIPEIATKRESLRNSSDKSFIHSASTHSHHPVIAKCAMVRILVTVALVCIFYCRYGFAIYANVSSSRKIETNPAIWTEEDGIWGPLLEDWATQPKR